jgi:hypothetical protein
LLWTSLAVMYTRVEKEYQPLQVLVRLFSPVVNLEPSHMLFHTFEEPLGVAFV